MSKVLRNFGGDYLFQKSTGTITNGGRLRITHRIDPRISYQSQEQIIESHQIFITTLLSDSVKEYIFSKLLDKSVDLLEEQVSPDKHRIDLLIC